MADGNLERVDLELHRELEIGNASATMEPYRFVGYDGKEIDPTGGEIAVDCFKPDGTPISGATVNIAGKLINFSVDTTGEQWELLEYYHAELALTVGGVVHRRFFYFDVVLYRLPMLISADHLPPDIKPSLEETDVSRILQLSRAQIMRAIRRHITFRGKKREHIRSALVRNPENFSDAMIHLVTAMACREAIREPDDRWGFLYREHYSLYKESLKEALETLDYDADEDAKIDAEEATLAPSPIMKR